MDLLITLIGNAAVDPGFRKLFLADPLETADNYGVRMTKGDFLIMTAMFCNLSDDERASLGAAFQTLEDLLYAKMENAALAPPFKKAPCTRPCTMSLFPPREMPELREIITRQMASEGIKDPAA